MSRPKPKYCADCKNKRIYRSEGQARGGLARLLRNGEIRREDFSLNVYACPQGNGFHFGHRSEVLRLLHRQ